jgi:hypothetical protein
MKFSSSSSTKTLGLLLAAVAASIPARAQDLLGDEPETGGWFVRLGAVARFNVKATLEASNPVLAPGHYNNGFVLPDVGGDPNLTWNWGYNNASQVDAGGNLNFQRYDNVPAVGRHNLNVDEPLLGGEVIGGYRFTEFEVFRRPVRVALVVGYGYADFSQDMGFTAAGTVTYTTASYALNGVTPPMPPYAGTAAGPGPLLSLTPSSTATSTSGATTTFQGKLDASFHSMRFGPSFEMDLAKNFSLEVGFGYSSVYADGSVSYTEATTFANGAVPAINAPATFDRQDWEPGAYFEVLGKYQFTRNFGAYLGGDYQRNNSLKLGDGAHKVRIDLSSTYAAKAGVIVSF